MQGITSKLYFFERQVAPLLSTRSATRRCDDATTIETDNGSPLRPTSIFRVRVCVPPPLQYCELAYWGTLNSRIRTFHRLELRILSGEEGRSASTAQIVILMQISTSKKKISIKHQTLFLNYVHLKAYFPILLKRQKCSLQISYCIFGIFRGAVKIKGFKHSFFRDRNAREEQTKRGKQKNTRLNRFWVEIGFAQRTSNG